MKQNTQTRALCPALRTRASRAGLAHDLWPRTRGGGPAPCRPSPAGPSRSQREQRSREQKGLEPLTPDPARSSPPAQPSLCGTSLSLPPHEVHVLRACVNAASPSCLALGWGCFQPCGVSACRGGLTRVRADSELARRPGWARDSVGGQQVKGLTSVTFCNSV